MQEEGTEPFGKRGKGMEDSGQLVMDVAESVFVGDALGKLEAEAEALRGQFPPTLDGFRTRQGVEGGVALNGVEDGGVVPQEIAGFRLCRKESAAPVRVGSFRAVQVAGGW